MTRAIMVQGTASGVGKSWLCAGLCRVLARRGLVVRPFKAWNMSNNAAPARHPDGGWGEIGRAQAVQAMAARCEPHVDMNPVLVKPEGGGRVQTIVRGRPGVPAWEAVEAAWARVSGEADVVVIEGAGSPAEINLRDVANMAVARMADAPVLLVGDIDRGGVFASLLGTLDLVDDRHRVAGLVINRFRGDVGALRPGLAELERRAGVPVRGVIPWSRGLVDEEDAVFLPGGVSDVDVCVLALPTVSNANDLAGLPARWCTEPARVGNPDLLVIPGSKDTLSDLAWLRARKLDRVVVAAAERGIPVLGLCGGYQILGERVEGEPGLGLLPVETTFSDKLVRPTRTRTTGAWLLPAGLPVEGYEIHVGRTRPGVELVEGDGAVVGLVAGTYLHGLLDADAVRAALIGALRARRGLDPAPVAALDREANLDAIADVVDGAVDLEGLL